MGTRDEVQYRTEEVDRQTKWDRRMLELAAHISSWSKDPSTQVGSVIYNDQFQILSVGYNGFPRGVVDDRIRYLDRETKLLFVAHAERNALDNCFVDCRGATLACTLFPCNECAKSIIQRGITRIVSTPLPDDDWYRARHKHGISLTMFAEAQIPVDFYALT